MKYNVKVRLSLYNFIWVKMLENQCIKAINLSSAYYSTDKLILRRSRFYVTRAF